MFSRRDLRKDAEAAQVQSLTKISQSQMLLLALGPGRVQYMFPTVTPFAVREDTIPSVGSRSLFFLLDLNLANCLALNISGFCKQSLTSGHNQGFHAKSDKLFSVARHVEYHLPRLHTLLRS